MKKLSLLITTLFLTFSVSVMAHNISTSEDKIFIKEMASDIGEYFHYEDSYKKFIYRIDVNDLPIKIKKDMNKQVEQRTLSLREAEYNVGNYAELDNTQYMVIKDGKIIGYVIHLIDSYEHPLWDGSGLHIYMDVEGNILTTIEWVG